MAHRGMIFGIFLAPFHRVGDNPTLAIRRDPIRCHHGAEWAATTRSGSRG